MTWVTAPAESEHRHAECADVEPAAVGPMNDDIVYRDRLALPQRARERQLLDRIDPARPIEDTVGCRGVPDRLPSLQLHTRGSPEKLRWRTRLRLRARVRPRHQPATYRASRPNRPSAAPCHSYSRGGANFQLRAAIESLPSVSSAAPTLTAAGERADESDGLLVTRQRRRRGGMTISAHCERLRGRGVEGAPR